MNILIAGDFFISDDFKNKELIDSSVIDLFEKSDYCIVNLEAPITPNSPENKILKTGPHLRTSEETIFPYLKQLKVDAVTLANNHILDYGEKGLSDTFNFLQNNEIDYVGAGNNLNEAAKPLTIEKEGMRIAILNFCEKEWSIAEDNKSGANPLDIIDNVNQIKSAKSNHDKVICIVHGGHEYYQLPSPRMQKQYRFYADNGADAIVGHHTHCISGYEIYKDVPIVYSLGNLLFTIKSLNEVWYNGLLCNLEINKNKPINFDLAAVVQEKETFAISHPEYLVKQKISQDIAKYSAIISDEIFLHKNWSRFIDDSQHYLNLISPINSIGNRYIRAFFNRCGIKKLLLSKKHYSVLTNIIRCEAHYDGLIWSLRKKGKAD